MSITRRGSAILGAFVAQALYLMHDLPTHRAAWGWTLTTGDDMGFKCEEQTSKGMVGCPDPTHGTGKMGVSPPKGACEKGEKTPCCRDTDFDCTVKPLSGYKCDVEKIKVTCSGDKFKKKQPDMPTVCINVGIPKKMKKTSHLSWSTKPTCTKEDKKEKEEKEKKDEEKFDVRMPAMNPASVPVNKAAVSLGLLGAAVVVGLAVVRSRFNNAHASHLLSQDQSMEEESGLE